MTKERKRERKRERKIKKKLLARQLAGFALLRKSEYELVGIGGLRSFVDAFSCRLVRLPFEPVDDVPLHAPGAGGRGERARRFVSARDTSILM